MQSGSLTSVYAADDTLTLADYPEYKDIVQKYYDGAAAGWNIGQFQEQNLCYLAGYYADINKLGYFLQDIDNNGTAELFIGALDDGSDTYEEMFFDMYTLINGRLSLVTTSGERDRYYLCTDNTIANEGSGSAFQLCKTILCLYRRTVKLKGICCLRFGEKSTESMVFQHGRLCKRRNHLRI